MTVPLAKIEPGAFRGLSEMRQLILAFHPLTELRPGVFDGLSNLRKLVVVRIKGLTTLEPGVFDGLSNLRSLDLRVNSLTTLPADLFDELSNLRYLYLAGNSLTTLPAGPFRGLAALGYLDLWRNQLRALEPGIFDGLAKLSYLNLSENNLRTLDPGLFDGLTALDAVKLGSNELTDLDPALFHGTRDGFGNSQMILLRLEGNQLATLNPELFRGMLRLERLDLAANRIAKLPPGLFEGLVSFGKLDLQDNPGTPFVFAPELTRRPGANPASGSAVTIGVEVAQGAPFDMRVPLSASGGVLSAEEVVIPRGAVRGMAVSVVPQGNGPVTVLAAAPGLPPPCGEWGFIWADVDTCMSGLTTSSGAPLVLYGMPDQTLAPAGAVRFDLASAFPNLAEGASYAVEVGNPAAVEATVREGLLIVSAANGGETQVAVAATGPDGRRETRRFRVKVLASPEAVGEISALSLVAGESVRVEVSARFRDPDGGPLAYAAESTAPAVAAASVDGGAVNIAGGEPGVASVTVTATDPDNLSATLTFTVTVNPSIGSLWGGWRSALLRPPPEDGGDGA